LPERGGPRDREATPRGLVLPKSNQSYRFSSSSVGGPPPFRVAPLLLPPFAGCFNCDVLGLAAGTPVPNEFFLAFFGPVSRHTVLLVMTLCGFNQTTSAAVARSFTFNVSWLLESPDQSPPTFLSTRFAPFPIMGLPLHGLSTHSSYPPSPLRVRPLSSLRVEETPALVLHTIRRADDETVSLMLVRNSRDSLR